MFLFPVAVSAEMYQGIGPYDSLMDVKVRFPGATFERFKPAWAKEMEVLYKITGPGLSGAIIVKLDDSRPFWIELYKQVQEKQDSKFLDVIRQILREGEDRTTTVAWVRWLPDIPVPFHRLFSKYGPPEKSGYSDTDYQPYHSWQSNGVMAFMTGDERSVVRIDFFFTAQDRIVAYRSKFGTDPPWSRESPMQLAPRKSM